MDFFKSNRQQRQLECMFPCFRKSFKIDGKQRCESKQNVCL